MTHAQVHLFILLTYGKAHHFTTGVYVWGGGGDQNKKENNIAPPLFIDMPPSQGNDWSYICDLRESIVCFYDLSVG